ncbi:Glycoside hydrolase, family 20, catalytic core [Kribbella flavida DSM 17836]|uniref:Glycoside hydrolase, family 20, catalytic core n=1 Tax=Kribbella flavida (strain DSM 17836 / JCM 10339 / NBRC 14399) TaxID=479435 RepID=D2PWQ8_KRIFD|nr:DUF4082 domain-containing protein [Kribbella flavida]ADB33527.1 Glycoside hydrolase, family 20, catalytic core [Kribbella flavida DSM 17836]
MSMPRRRFLTISSAAVAAGLVQTGTVTPAGAQADAAAALPPPTIPNLQSWTAAAGQYTLPATVRIIVSTAHSPTLRTTADVLAEDLRKVTRRTVTVVEQTSPAPAAGDIVLTLAAVIGLNDEGYELQVGSSMQVRGTKSGVFYGTRTVVQWLRQATVVPGGVARDWPKYPDRGFLVANAAKYYTPTWWQGQIQEMSYLKMNLLWFSPGYDTAPLNEMKDMAAYAARYNIGLVPLTNMPGHMGKLLATRPDLALPGRAEALDLSKDAAYTFAKNDVITPMLGHFPSRYWHLGADEYLVDFSGDFPVRYDLFPELGAKARERFGSDAVPPDVLYGFINDMNDHVRANGRQLRIWNDGLLTSVTEPVDTNVIVEHWVHWTGRRTPSQLLNAGYQVSNSNGDFLYHDPGARRPEPKPIYDNFHPGVFNGETVDPNTPGLRGAKLHLWTLPDRETEEFQSDRLMEPFRALSQVLWGSPKLHATYDGGFSSLIGTLGRPPGFPAGRHTLSPVNGATSVWPHRPIRVQFYDTIDASTLQLYEGGTEAGTPGRMTYDAAAKVATFTPNAPWTYGKLCDAHLRARDTAGNTISRDWTFRIAQAPTLAYPRSLWADEVGPAVERYSDGRPLELGVRFRTDRPGVVLGIKFYKAPGDFGLHTGSLWSSSGQRLATAEFTSESAAGWQEVRFAQPVRIAAGTTYVASYFTPSGTYGYNQPFFAGHSVDNGVLHAPADINGVFAYGASVFPNESYQTTNYWADVVFQPDTYTIWDVKDAPVFGATEPTSMELGVRFQARAAGRIHGIRFFKGTHNTGVHVGSLWTASGTRLASATFTGESASGWQEVRFATPVSIAANTTFVASYSSPTGAFSATEQGLAAAKVNGVLQTLPSTVQAPNGVFATSQGVFPTSSYQARNYYTDVVFSQA